MRGKLTEMRAPKIAVLTLAAGLLLTASAAAGGPVLHLPDALPNRTIDLPILMYHRIGPVDPSLPAVTRTLTVSPEDFAGQMDWLHSHAYHAVSRTQR